MAELFRVRGKQSTRRDVPVRAAALGSLREPSRRRPHRDMDSRLHSKKAFLEVQPSVMEENI